jgi:prepilin-type N-terminal cleavage/methylation domain-containing protein
MRENTKIVNRRNKRIGKNKRGFTLIEVIVVIVIIAILAAIAVPALTGYIDKAKYSDEFQKLRYAEMALKAMYIEEYAAGWTSSSGGEESPHGNLKDYNEGGIFSASSTPGVRIIAPTESGQDEFRDLCEREGIVNFYSNNYPMYAIFVDQYGSIVGSVFINLELLNSVEVSSDTVFEVLKGVDIVDGNPLDFELVPSNQRIITVGEM